MSSKKDKNLFILLNVGCWLGIALLSFFTFPHKESPDFIGCLLRCSLPVAMCIIFYINYLWLIPYADKKNNRKIYHLGNIFFVFALAIVLHICILSIDQHEPNLSLYDIEKPLDHLIYIIRCIPILALSAGVATVIYMSVRWNSIELARHKAELERQEAEIKRKDAEMKRKEAEARQVTAELKTLQTQISPHVLLNNLNNIYALIAFDKEKAQRAVVSLSKTLGYILYSWDAKSINLKDDVELMEHFIDLMRIRLTDNVKVDVDIQLPDPCFLKIAPFIYVSLIENAFKHGVSTVKPSFVKISLVADQDKIDFSVTNSYHPKDSRDKDSHGIGLEQVRKRLELLYPGKYKWEKGYDEKKEIYTSNIIIYDTKMCHY